MATNGFDAITPNPSSNWWTNQPSTPASPNYAPTQWGDQMLEQNPSTAYYMFGMNNGVPDDGSAWAKWFRSNFGNFQTGYNAYTVTNPLTANIEDYAKSLDINKLMQQFKDLAPSVRGENPGVSAGPARWIER